MRSHLLWNHRNYLNFEIISHLNFEWWTPGEEIPGTAGSQYQNPGSSKNEKFVSLSSPFLSSKHDAANKRKRITLANKRNPAFPKWNVARAFRLFFLPSAFSARVSLHYATLILSRLLRSRKSPLWNVCNSPDVFSDERLVNFLRRRNSDRHKTFTEPSWNGIVYRGTRNKADHCLRILSRRANSIFVSFCGTPGSAHGHLCGCSEMLLTRYVKLETTVWEIDRSIINSNFSCELCLLFRNLRITGGEVCFAEA